jgi:hypothetical protein
MRATGRIAAVASPRFLVATIALSALGLVYVSTVADTASSVEPG